MVKMQGLCIKTQREQLCRPNVPRRMAPAADDGGRAGGQLGARAGFWYSFTLEMQDEEAIRE